MHPSLIVLFLLTGASAQVSGTVSTLAGLDYGSSDGFGANASFAAPTSVAVDGSGLFAIIVWTATMSGVWFLLNIANPFPVV
jgi:hypothetical protein